MGKQENEEFITETNDANRSEDQGFQLAVSKSKKEN